MLEKRKLRSIVNQLTEPSYGNKARKMKSEAKKLLYSTFFFVKHILCRRDNRSWCGMAVILMIPSS